MNNGNLANSAGLVSFNILSVNALYIDGNYFDGSIDNTLQGEIDDINTTLTNVVLPIVSRIDFSALNGNLVITDANKNSVLKTAIDTINTQIAGFNKFDLTGLTGSCVITDATTNQALNGLISTNTSNIATNTSNIATNTSNIATNTSNIATNTSNIATNTSNIATNTSAISSINSQISAINNTISSINAKLAHITTWSWGSNTFTGIKDGTGFAVALGNGTQYDDNGIYCYENDSDQTAQIRIQTQNAKQLYMSGGSATLIYAGSNDSITNRNLVRIGGEANHIQIGVLTTNTKFPLIHIGNSGAGILSSTTEMRGSWYFNSAPTSVYTEMMTTNGNAASPYYQQISTTNSPFFKGLDVIDPAGLITLSAVVGGVLLNSGAGVLALSSGIGAIALTTAGGAITLTAAGGAISLSTGGGALSLSSGAGVMNFATADAAINTTTLNADIYLGAGKGAGQGSTSGNINLRAKGNISISPDTETQIDNTAYIEMKSGQAPSPTTRKLYHHSNQLYYDGVQLSNQTAVKALTQGDRITLTDNNGNYTITANNQVADYSVKALTQGDRITLTDNAGNITITANNQVADYSVKALTQGDRITLTDNAGNITITADDQFTGFNVKDLTEGDRITITNDNAGNYTIAADDQVSDYLIKNITAGSGIDVQINASTKTATITNLNLTSQATQDEDQALVEVGALPRKPDYWGTNWVIADDVARLHLDMFVSVDGQVIVSASGYYPNRYSRDYGITWGAGDFDRLWTSVCGTSQGSKIFGFAIFISQTQVENLVFYTSLNQGQNWTQRASAAFTNLTKVNRVRCSGNGQYLVASVNNSATGGRFLYSATGRDEVPTWTSKLLLTTLPSGRTEGVAMSRSGATQFITWINDANNDSKIFRSLDYGATWTEVFGHIANGNWTRVECDATGRFVWATRLVNISTPNIPAWYSDNYGSGWYQSSINGLEDMWVSATGQFVAGVSNPQGSGISYFVYSSDYGRTFIGVGNPASSVNNTYRTINGSGDGSVLVLGSSNQTESGYVGDGKIRIAREGRQNIQDLSVVGGGTIAKTGGVYTLTIPPTTIWSHTNCIDFLISQSGNLITLPNPVDLLLYDMEMQLSAMLQYDPDNPTNTLMGIYFNSFYSGKSIWTNQIHNGAEFGAAGTYSQNWLNPVFAYIPTNQNKFIQSISTNFQVSMLSNWGTPNNERPIRVRFQTSIAAGDNEALFNAYQDQAGHIQVFSKTTSFSPKTTIFNIGINQYSGGGGSSYRQSPASVPARLVIHLKRKAAY